MTPPELCDEAARLGLRLEPAGDKLAVLPKERCPPDFADVLRANKTVLTGNCSSRSRPGHGTVPPASLSLVSLCPRPSIRTRELVIHYLLRQTGDKPGQLAAWLVHREARYFDGPGGTWDCGALAYAAARDAACWQLRRSEQEVWQLLAGFDEAASTFGT